MTEAQYRDEIVAIWQRMAEHTRQTDDRIRAMQQEINGIYRQMASLNWKIPAWMIGTGMGIVGALLTLCRLFMV